MQRMALRRAAVVLRVRGGNVTLHPTTVKSTSRISARRAFLSTNSAPQGGPGHESYLGNPEKHDHLFNDKNVTQSQDFEDKSRPLDDPEQNKKLAEAAQAMQDDSAVGQDSDPKDSDSGNDASEMSGGEEGKKRAGSGSHKLAKDTHHRSNKAGMYEDEVGPDGSPWAS